MDLKTRVDQPELMDTQTFPLPVMEETLRFLSQTNRYFGGAGVIIRYFDLWSQKWEKGKPISILDIGTGAGDIPAALLDWAQVRGFQLKITGIDPVPEIIQIAKTRIYKNKPSAVEFQVESFQSLATQGRQFDYVLGSLLLHHIAPKELIPALKIMDRMAKKGIIFSDLRRSSFSYFAVWGASRLWGNHVVRHDGPLSVRRAFTLMELQHLSQESGLGYLRARKEPWFRLSWAGEK